MNALEALLSSTPAKPPRHVEPPADAALVAAVNVTDQLVLQMVALVTRAYVDGALHFARRGADDPAVADAALAGFASSYALRVPAVVAAVLREASQKKEN